MTPQEMHEAQSVHLRSGRHGGRIAMIALLGCCALALLLTRLQAPGVIAGFAVVASIALLLLLLVVAVIVFVLSPKQFQPFIERTVLPAPRTSGSIWSFDSSGIVAEHGRLRLNFKWAAVRAVIESEHLFLLYTGKYRYSALPKRVFTEAQLDEFRQLLKESLSGPIAAFPVIIREEKTDHS